ncbi:transmembrane prolyl 4-hydroxylase-like [Dreissena polymorpha]|uniref:Fe2OG dioxygenase domain-containing protein n=1 Tax=Dreissena polymorpha TaxID=45954 RepID=A0A9D3YUR8_DREPO|nr:transmembrane prolyl 4-hydroxylase-like [Dreissena polymorpha]KAH3706134.1 hypothetical protein DPMN_065514 [Dreissena polymorpha]
MTANEQNVEFLTNLQTKVATLLGVPVEVIKYSQPLTISQYWPGGYYHAHLDSSFSPRSKPCCFQTECPSINGTDIDSIECCQLCRVATVLHYLEDVDEGGETAFVFADKPLSHIHKTMETEEWSNLSKNCEQAALRIKPKKGTTILWYNHFLDRRGYLSAVDQRSHHGGCDVKRGIKYIATNWVQTPFYRYRLLPSKYLKK